MRLVVSASAVHRLSGGTRVFAARGKRLCCRPHPQSDLQYLYSYGYNDSMWTVNGTLSLGCNYVMQWNLDWSVATAKNANANSQEAAKFQNSIFLPLQMPPPAQCRPGLMLPFPPSRRHWIAWKDSSWHDLLADEWDVKTRPTRPSFQEATRRLRRGFLLPLYLSDFIS